MEKEEKRKREEKKLLAAQQRKETLRKANIELEKKKAEDESNKMSTKDTPDANINDLLKEINDTVDVEDVSSSEEEDDGLMNSPVKKKSKARKSVLKGGASSFAAVADETPIRTKITPPQLDKVDVADTYTHKHIVFVEAELAPEGDTPKEMYASLHEGLRAIVSNGKNLDPAFAVMPVRGKKRITNHGMVNSNMSIASNHFIMKKRARGTS